MPYKVKFLIFYRHCFKYSIFLISFYKYTNSKVCLLVIGFVITVYEFFEKKTHTYNTFFYEKFYDIYKIECKCKSTSLLCSSF